MYLFEAALNGLPLSAIAQEILLLDIEEPEPEETSQTDDRALHHGTRRSEWNRKNLTVRLRMMIRTQNILHRTKIMQDVTQWAARGGWLTINTRPGQRLRVQAGKLPTLGSALKWTSEIEIAFRAYERPFWEDETPTSVTITGNGSLRFAGAVSSCPVEVLAVNKGDAPLTSILFSCGDTFIKLDALTLAAGETVSITYTDDDLLTILAGGQTALSTRTADSDDDLLAVPCTDNEVSVTADQPVSVTFRVRGRWL